MTRDEFWALIEKHISVHEDLDAQHGAVVGLTAELASMGEQACLDFDHHFRTLSMAGYSQELWGAAYVINGGCSDDMFDYFRGWLIGRGRTVYERALADPDSLAEQFTSPDEVSLEDVLSAGMSAWVEASGKGYGDFKAEAVPAPELGEDWDFDDEAEMRRRYPKLCAIFYA